MSSPPHTNPTPWAETDERRAQLSLALAMIAFALGTGLGLGQLGVVTFDGLLEYIRDARVLSEQGLGAYRHAVHPIGYPSLLAALRHATPSLFAASRLASWIAGLAVLPLYTLLVRRALGPRAAAWAPWLAIAGSALVAHTLEPSSTLPAAALQLASIVTLAENPERRSRLVAAGILVGLAWLVRYPSILVFGATATWLVIRGWREPRRLLADLAAYTVPFVCVASPQWVLNLSHGLDPFIADNAGYILRAERGHFAHDQTIVSMLLLEGGRAARFWAKNLSLFVLFNAPLLAAMAWLWRARRTTTLGYLGTVVVLQQLVLALTNFNPKFYLLDRWLLLAFLLGALGALAPRLRAAWSPRDAAPGRAGRAARVLVAGLAAAALAPALAAYLVFRVIEIHSLLGVDEIGETHRALTQSLYDRGYRGSSEILGCSNVHYDLRLLDRDEVAYYRDAAVGLPEIPRFASPAAFVDFLHEHGFRFVLYDEEDRGPCPDLGFLFVPERLPATLEPVWIDDFYNQTDRVALYAVSDGPSPATLTDAEKRARWQRVRRPSLKGVLDDWARRSAGEIR
ncbi:MAG: glycosyltransferase family 39 protein [bacterium]